MILLEGQLHMKHGMIKVTYPNGEIAWKSRRSGETVSCVAFGGTPDEIKISDTKTNGADVLILEAGDLAALRHSVM